MPPLGRDPTVSPHPVVGQEKDESPLKVWATRADGGARDATGYGTPLAPPATKELGLTAGRALSFPARSVQIWLPFRRGHRGATARGRPPARPAGARSLDRPAPGPAERAGIGRGRPGGPCRPGGG